MEINMGLDDETMRRLFKQFVGIDKQEATAKLTRAEYLIAAAQTIVKMMRDNPTDPELQLFMNRLRGKTGYSPSIAGPLIERMARGDLSM